MGLTETAAKADGIECEVQKFPWAASGRALGLGRPEGLTKLLVSVGDTNAGRVLGCGIVGISAGDLISEAVLALEMNADAQDIALTIHPTPPSPKPSPSPPNSPTDRSPISCPRGVGGAAIPPTPNSPRLRPARAG